MAADSIQQQDAVTDDVEVHERNYHGFLKVLKWSMGAVAIITAIVILIIAR